MTKYFLSLNWHSVSFRRKSLYCGYHIVHAYSHSKQKRPELATGTSSFTLGDPRKSLSLSVTSLLSKSQNQFKKSGGLYRLEDGVTVRVEEEGGSENSRSIHSLFKLTKKGSKENERLAQSLMMETNPGAKFLREARGVKPPGESFDHSIITPHFYPISPPFKMPISVKDLKD